MLDKRKIAKKSENTPIIVNYLTNNFIKKTSPKNFFKPTSYKKSIQ